MTAHTDGAAAARPFDDPAAFIELLASAELRAPYVAAALDVLCEYAVEPLDAASRQVQAAWFDTFAVEARATMGPRARLSELAPLPAAFAERRRRDEEEMETLARAMHSVAVETAAGAALRSMYAGLLSLLLPEAPAPDWSDADLAVAAHRTRSARRAAIIEALAAQLHWSDLELPRRLADPAVDRFIGRCAERWSAFTERRPAAPDNSALDDYRAPFARMIVAIWPALEAGPAPSNRSLRRSLARQATYPAD